MASGLVILDRDGVINHDSKTFIKSPDEWRPLPGSIEAIAALSEAGFRVAVASNQSGVGRGLFDMETLAAIHHKMRELVLEAGGEIAGIAFCPHRPDEGCECRKPAIGLLTRISEELNLSLAGAVLVGDSERDIKAAVTAGCRPVLVLTGNGASAVEAVTREWPAVAVVDDLAAAASMLLEESGQEEVR